KTGGDIARFYKVSKDFLSDLNQRPEIQYANTAFNPNFPEYLMNVNIPKVKNAGMSLTDITGAMQGYFGGVYASNFNKFGQQFRVVVQADPKFRMTPASLNAIYVRARNGQMVPITEF